MIPRWEILEKARTFGVPVSTIERDYAQGWLLRNLSSVNMALKGGTGIRKIFIEDYRFSDDLDFTLLDDIQAGTIETEIKQALLKTREESGINFSENLNFSKNENGFEVNVYFQVMQRGTSWTRIKIDITRHANEVIILPIQEKQIIHVYSDAFSSKIKTYLIEEIFAEKVRSLFQRTRPRDIYDVWYLSKIVNMENVRRVLPQKFSVRNVKFEINEFLSRKNDYENAWKNSLRHQLKQLPDFKEVFDDVLNLLKHDVRL